MLEICKHGSGVGPVQQWAGLPASGFETCQALTDMIYLTVGDLDIPNQIPERFHTL